MTRITVPRYDPSLKPLLEEAAGAYARRDDDAFRECMERAFGIAPWRLDFGFNLAQKHIQTNAPDRALTVYRAMHDMVPADPDVATCLAHWMRYFGNPLEAESLLAVVDRARPGSAEGLNRLWSIVDRWLAAPWSERVPVLPDGGADAFVAILGYLLAPDGGMTEILRGRLRRGLEVAAANPSARILVTGGMPRAGRVEAREMRNWLEENGVASERILEEGYSRDVVENALYSRQILDVYKARRLVIVTSPIDFRRAGAVYETVGWTSGSVWVTEASVASRAPGDEFTDDGRDKLKLYRDTVRAFGVMMMRTFPEIAER